ncbi:hypothetical protein J7K07_02490 [Candidatus Bathyarchaeota archaeon]|nr:hypothetical protein [Candidatus Bathyarchaeota archaeon]
MKALSNKIALSTVVTTLIILVVSVLLAGVVTMYAVNITSTRTQQEDLRLSKQVVWVNVTGDYSYAALTIDNVGGRDVVIDKIQVRGVETSWSNVAYLRLDSPVSGSLLAPNSSYASSLPSTDFEYVSGTTGDFSTASSDIPLASGDTLVIYIKNPDSISSSDIGTTVGITVFTESAQYYVECNVQTSEEAS